MSEPSSAIRLGDYVLATKFSDADPQDPWRVGFVCQIIQTWKRGTAYVIGEKNGTWQDHRHYKYARRITAEQGRKWLERVDPETPLRRRRTPAELDALAELTRRT